MQPDGLLPIHDFFQGETMDGPLFPTLFPFNMLINNNGRSYSAAATREMMLEADPINIVDCSSKIITTRRSWPEWLPETGHQSGIILVVVLP